MKKQKIIYLALIAAFAITKTNAQNLIWAKQYDSPNYTNALDYGRAVTVDQATGDVYVTGGIDQSNATPVQDKKIYTAKYNVAGVLQWQTITNGWVVSSSSSFEKGNAIALDGQGNLWVAGTIDNSVTARDIALIKYNASTGTIAVNYPKRYPDNSGILEVGGYSLSVVNSTNVYVGGRTYDQGTTLWHGIVLKDDPTGTGWAWTYTFTGLYNGTNPSCTVTDIKNDASGAVYFTGWKYDTSSDSKLVTGKLSSTGTLLWTQTYNPYNLEDRSYALTLVNVSPAADVYIAGRARSNNGQQLNGIVVKYNGSNGNFMWVHNTGFAGKDEGYVDITSVGNCGGGISLVYACGHIEQNQTPWNWDYMVTALNASTGAVATCWGTNPQYYDGSACPSNSCGEPGGVDFANAIEYSPQSGLLYVTGTSFETISSQNSTNITTRCYNGTTGAVIWSRSYDYGTDLIINADLADYKNCLAIRYDTYLCKDEVFITGESFRQHTLPQVNSFDVTTLKYACGTCAPCGPPPNSATEGRFAGFNVGFYPNPFNTTANLVIDDVVEIINAELKVFDMNGKEVMTITNINQNNIVIEKGNLNQGIYFYQLADALGLITKGKFIIQE
jgi:hypothetical protein